MYDLDKDEWVALLAPGAYACSQKTDCTMMTYNKN